MSFSFQNIISLRMHDNKCLNQNSYNFQTAIENVKSTNI